MEQTEQQLIDGLFSRLQQAQSQSGPRDPQAEAHIRHAVQQQPAAPYYMAQAILVQEHALAQLKQQVEQLEQELRERPASSGGFLGGLFGAGSASPPRDPQPARAAQPLTPPAATGAAGRGSFMGSAMQTAVAVAGGVLVGNLLANMFTSTSAEAAEPNLADDSAGFEDTGSYGQDDFQSADSDFGGFDDLGDF